MHGRDPNGLAGLNFSQKINWASGKKEDTPTLPIPGEMTGTVEARSSQFIYLDKNFVVRTAPDAFT